MMQELINNQSTLKIDIAFKPCDFKFSNDLTPEISSGLDIDCSEIWIEEIKNWIGYLRSNTVYNPPPVILENLLFSLGLEFTDDRSIAELNSSWRNKQSPTDVLSFPILGQDGLYPKDQYIELGDIVVSVETAHKQALSHNHSLLYELRWLVCHGFLHLLGWDHSDESSFNEMMLIQEKLLCFSSHFYLKVNSKDLSANE